MKSAYINRDITYTGAELAPHWIYKNHNLQGDAIVAFEGKCDVALSEMVDIADVIENSPIYSERMLNFIIEHFNMPLLEGVSRQRLFVCIIKEQVEKATGLQLERDGDDLFFNGGKLSVSIATKSPTSVLIHTALNIISDNTPVKAAGLSSDMNFFDIKELAYNILNAYTKEHEEIIMASTKVRGVI